MIINSFQVKNIIFALSNIHTKKSIVFINDMAYYFLFQIKFRKNSWWFYVGAASLFEFLVSLAMTSEKCIDCIESRNCQELVIGYFTRCISKVIAVWRAGISVGFRLRQRFWN